MMKTPILLTSLVSAALLTGCIHNCYLVEITPDGDGFQRTLTCWRSSGDRDSEPQPLSEEELEKIGRLYQRHETIEDGKKHVFVGRFTGKTPADVGGAGSYAHFVSPMGTLTSYVERFRGNDDLEAELARRRAAADQLVDLLLGWFQLELGQEPGFDRLGKFIDRDLRQDLKNLGIYDWTRNAVGGYETDAGAEFLVRAGHYLGERGYLGPKDIPTLARALTTNDPTKLLRHVQRLVARNMGVSDEQPIPPSLAFLSDASRLEASWSGYLQTTDFFRRQLARWEQQKAANPDAPQPTPDSVTQELVGEALLKFGPGGDRDWLEVKLHCAKEPAATNGTWDQQAGTVRWSATLEPARSLPALCFAFWSCPNQGFQEAHFGRVVLADEDLAQYVLWYRGLDEQEAAQWDGLIEGCVPGADLKAALEAFRFTTDPPPDPSKPDEKPASLADTPRQLILDALERAGGKPE